MRKLAHRLILTAVSVITIAAIGIMSYSPVMKASAAGDNLVLNPSFETTSASNPTLPANWTFDSWGKNTVKSSWETKGKDGGRSVKLVMCARKNGDAKWMSDNIALKPSTKYQLSDWYISNVRTSLELAYTHTNGSVTYAWLSNVAASSAWKKASASFTTPADVKSATVYHVLARNGSLQTDLVELHDQTVTTPTPVPTAPTVSITAPAANATVSGTQNITANASDAVKVTGVQFQIDGVNFGAEDVATPYSVSLETTTLTNAKHTITAIARNSSNLTATTTESITVNNFVTPPAPTAPTVAITSPATGATLSGSQTITANASDAVGLSGVQFKLDGANLGTEDTVAPYSAAWDTTTAANGTHTLTATARNNSGLTSTATVSVTVNNTVTTPDPTPAPTNLIANPSVETAENSTKPVNWAADYWGTNTTAFSYLTTGHTGTRSLKTNVTAYTSGDAKWHFGDVAVTAGKTYQYSNWYQSNVDTEVDAAVTMADGSVNYYYLTTASASSNWAKVSAQFTAPVNAKSITIFQVIAKKGFIISDDFSLTEYTPAGFSRAMVSLTFDDGWRSQYTNGLPLLDKYGMNATFYLLTETTDYPDYMTVAMMQSLKDHGNELDSHTVSHPHLPQLTVAQIDQELSQSQGQLRNWFGSNVADDFATPYGEYNSTVLNEIKKYYRSHRSVDEGFNSKDNFDIYNIKVQNVLYSTTAAQVQAWVEQAQREHTWLVLVYHEVDSFGEDPTYSVTSADLDAQLSAIKNSGIAVQTVGNALNEIQSQL